ncbi:hypothetical protein ABVT39_026415, partial [Epinephelus coioides]
KEVTVYCCNFYIHDGCRDELNNLINDGGELYLRLTEIVLLFMITAWILLDKYVPEYLTYYVTQSRLFTFDKSLCVSFDVYRRHSAPFRISRTASQSPCRLAVYRRKGQGKLSRSQPLRDGETAGRDRSKRRFQASYIN